MSNLTLMDHACISNPMLWLMQSMTMATYGATRPGQLDQGHQRWSVTPRLPGQHGMSPAHSPQDLKMIMELCFEMVLGHHVVNHVAKDHDICDFFYLELFQMVETHKTPHTTTTTQARR